MKIKYVIFLVFFFLATGPQSFAKDNRESESVNLPQVKLTSTKSLLNLLQQRQSVRQFKSKQLTLGQVSLLLWAAAGTKLHSSMKLPNEASASDSVTFASRTVPSAGACNPIDVYLYVQSEAVKGLEKGLYQYLPQKHSLELTGRGTDDRELVSSCWDQAFIGQSPIVIIIAAEFKRTTSRYGKRGERYVYLDAGHVGQNIYLMSTELSLATVEVGSFDDRRLAACLKLPSSVQPILVMPVGHAL